MVTLILCAGYAVRLYPLTQNTPKPLLSVGSRPMLEYLVDKVNDVDPLGEIFIVTNGKFDPHFRKWAAGQAPALKNRIQIVNDQTTSNETRLGAIGDMNLVLKEARIKEDVLVLAGDNFFTFDLREFVRISRSHSPDASVGLFDVQDKKLAQNYGLVELGPNAKIRTFLEKPRDPQTTLASTGIYYFPAGTLSLLETYVTQKNNPDAPGYFVQWLIERSQVFGIVLGGMWYDIGDLVSYEKVNQIVKEGLTA